MPSLDSHSRRFAVAALVGAAIALSVPAAFAQESIASGTYTGNGSGSRAISGVGFAPDLVIVKSVEAEHAYCRTATMGPGLSASLGDNKALETDRILSLDGDGFTVGGDNAVNDVGREFHWIAMRDDGGHLALGSYTGEGTGYLAIAGLGFNPAAVIVISNEAQRAVVRTETMPVSRSAPLALSPVLTDAILAFADDGFAVGTNEAVNKAGVEMHYIAWAGGTDLVAAGTYKGDGIGGRAVSDVGFPAGWLLIRAGADEDGVHRPATLAGDGTLLFRNQTVRSDVIRSTNAAGFVLGTDTAVNAPGVDYHWLAFRDRPAGADLGIALAADIAAPNVGQVVTFTATLRNAGPDDAIDAGVKLTVPAGLVFQAATPSQGGYDPGTGNWTVGNLAGGATVTLDLAATVAPGTGGSTLTVAALAAAQAPDDPDPLNDEADVSVTVPAADLVLAALVNDAGPDVGGTVVFTAALTNAGPDDATGVALSALLPPGLAFAGAAPSVGAYNDLTGTWDIGTIPTGSTATLTLLASPEPGTGGATLVLPLAVTAADQEDPLPANNSRNVAVTVTSADLALAKSVDDTTPDIGATVTFRLDLVNNGPSHATGVEVRDLLPAGLDFAGALTATGAYDDATGLWTIGRVDSGDTVSLDLQATVTGGTGAASLTNTAAVFSADQEDPDPANDKASASVTVSGTDLELRKEVDNLAPAEGDTVVYTVTVINNGPKRATGVAVVDSLPVGVTFVEAEAERGTYSAATGTWSLGAIPVDENFQLQITAVVDAGTNGTTIVNEARISASDLSDPVPGNDRESVAITVASTDLQLAKTVDDASPVEGDPVVYTLTLTNAGPNPATGVAVTDSLPAGLTPTGATPGAGTWDAGTGTWDVGALAVGDTVTLALSATVDPGTAGSTIVNTAAITGADLADPAPGNNSAAAALTVAATDLQVTKIVDDATPSVGGTVVYTVTVTNAGPNDATGVAVTDFLPGGLSLGTATPTQGAYDPETGLWTVGTVDIGNSAVLTLTATVDAAAAGRNIVNTATVTAVDQADPVPGNDSDTAAIDVPEIAVTPVVAVRAVPGAGSTVAPGSADRLVLHLELANLGAVPDTLSALTLTNLTSGVGAPSQADVDAEWGPLTVTGQRRGLAGTDPAVVLDPESFTAGSLVLDDLTWAIGPGDTLSVRVTGAPSLGARDGAVLRLGVTAPEDVVVAQTVVVSGELPLNGGQDLTVDGFVAAQAALVNVPSGSLAVGSARNPALAVRLPSNGYLADAIYGLTLVNRGSAEAGADIALMEAWADDGNGVFDAGDDLLGTVVNSGELWQLTGLSAPVPPGGRFVFVTIDIAETALPGRDVRLELPVETGDAVIMASGNDGPRDVPLTNTGVLAITVDDRLVLSTEPVAPGVVRPGARDVPLLVVNVANTYADERSLQSLTVTSAVLADPGASAAERDSVLRQVVLRLDGDADGVLDDFGTDPALGSGSFSGGEITFSGLGLAVPPGDLVRIFVTGDVDLGGAADGDILAATVDGPDAVWAPGTALVAAWPLDSGAAWTVDGMVAAQVVSTPVAGRTLGPGDGPEPALDLFVPGNGYLADRLVGLALVEQGTAVPADLDRVRLWADDGDDAFDSVLDEELGSMSWLNGRWVSPVLALDVPAGGRRIFVAVDAATAPTDSATVRLAVPSGGIVMASDNSGPVDEGLPPGGTLVLSTSALVARVDFDRGATSTGRTGTVRLTVRNVGSEPVSGITPTLTAGDGPGSVGLGAPAPAILDLAPGGSGEFAWTFTAGSPGTLTLVGSASGTGDVTSLAHASAPSPSPLHRVTSAVPRLDAFPVTNLPASVIRGQAGLAPLTFTLANPGDADVADARLDSLVIRVAETATGPAIVPADLFGRVTLAEGSNVYADVTLLPAAGDEIVLRLAPPAVITGDEPVTLGLRVDVLAGSTAPSFLLAVDGAASIHATDAVSGLPVPVALGSGTFPVQTRQANLVSPAGGLQVTTVPDTARAVPPGRAGVPLASLNLANDATDPTASPIRVEALGFTVRDAAGVPLADPASLLASLTVADPGRTLFSGVPQFSDSLVIALLTTPLEVPVGATIAVDLAVDLRPAAPLGALRFAFADRGQWNATDAGDGAAVAVTVAPANPNTGLAVVAPISGLVASGAGTLSATAGRGARNLPALTLTLAHPGTAAEAPARWDSLVLRVRDAARAPFDPDGLLDRVRVRAGAVEVGLLVDPAAPDGVLVLPLAAPLLAAGDTITLAVEVDVRSDAPLAGFELVAELPGLVVRDTVTGTAPPLGPAGTWPVWSGLATVVVPSDALEVSGTSLMPALLAPQAEPAPVMALELANPAAAGAGPVELVGLSLTPAATGHDFMLPGSAVGTVVVLQDGVELGRNGAVAADAGTLDVVLDTPLTLPASTVTRLEVRVGIRSDVSAGRLRLALDAAGVIASEPGLPPGGIAVGPAPGTVFPLETEVGNVGAASLADSYVNFPNPFAAGRESTTFAFWLRTQATVSLRLFTPQGESVATLLDAAPRAAGLHQADAWDGLNGRGIVIRNGVYLAELVVDYADGQRERVLRKVAVVR